MLWCDIMNETEINNIYEEEGDDGRRCGSMTDIIVGEWCMNVRGVWYVVGVWFRYIIIYVIANR